ncbi:MAG: class I SAM-dependent methyltransferase [Bacteroidota bacterium]
MDKYIKKYCRYCDTELPDLFLNLGSMALANSFIPNDGKEYNEFECPLSICRCNKCNLVQLSHVVPAELMFAHYLYVSSTTATFKKHFFDYAVSVLKKSLKKTNLLAVDIGSNDGLLLNYFMQNGAKAIGVDPATNLTNEANNNGIPTINRYFDEESVNIIINTHGKADIITANNVFAHIDDSQSVCKNVFKLLNDNGMFVIEFPYLLTMLDKMLFDMIYHEHQAYIALTSLRFLLNKYKLDVFDVEFVSSHGGSLRVFAQKHDGIYPISQAVKDMLRNESEKGLGEQKLYNDFAEKVYCVKKTLNEFVYNLKKEGKRICGYGAPAKGNTIINFCGFTRDQIDYIVDDNILKQNTLSPGANIPVVSSSYMAENKPDYIIIFAWNFAEEILKKLEIFKNQGVKFIIPLPEPIIK